MKNHCLFKALRILSFVASAALLSVGVLFNHSALAADDWPNRTIRLVVPFAAGGGVDNVARSLAVNLGESLGQSVIVENKVGAGGLIGTEFVAKSIPDGYTLLMGTQTTLAVAPILTRGETFNPPRLFSGVSLVASAPMLLVTNPKFPAHNLVELIELAKQRPGKINYGSGGLGTTPHMAGELLALSTGIRMTHVPYKGEQPALVDVMGNQISLMFSNMQSALPLVQSGKILAIAISSAERSASSPDVPTVSESGVAGFSATTWFGVVAPKATPKAVVDKLAIAIEKALDEPRFRRTLEGQGVVIQKLGPARFDTYISDEYEKWNRVIKQARITLE